MVPVDMDKRVAYQSFPQGSHHYFLVLCGLCKQQLPLSNMYLLGPEVHQINQAFANLSVPVSLPEMVSVCKLCYYFGQLCLGILEQNKIKVSGSEDKSGLSMPPQNEPSTTKFVPSATKSEGKIKKGKLRKLSEEYSVSNDPPLAVVESGNGSNSIVSMDCGRAGASTPTIESNSLAHPNTSQENLSASIHVSSISSPASTSSKQPLKIPRFRMKVSNTTLNPTTEMQSVLSPLNETYCSGQLHMQPGVDFRSSYQPGSGKSKGDWETYNATLKFTKQTKKDFMNLQKPYGTDSNFMRHLMLLEKYWRSGDLILSSNASDSAKTYLTRINNRIKSFEGPMPRRAHLPVPTTSAPHVSPALPSFMPRLSVKPLSLLQPVVPSQESLPMPPPPVANCKNNSKTHKKRTK
ncbi:Uncharacterized protein GBIM_10093 [Gryllus bimaculatus]|nr:Uncharacterized protein GBIM_10093 [Gryllus bimaculatus]